MGIRRFFRRRDWDDERARELDAYLAQEIDDNVARGMTPGQARIAAHRKLGNATRIREDIYDLNSVRWFETTRLDLRDAVRYLLRRRTPAIATVALLTIGIGASTAGFGIAYGTLLRPLPYPDAGRLVTLWQETDGRRDQISAPDFRDLRAIPAFESAALLWSGRATLTSGVDVDRVTTVEAEAPLLAMLGARPILGRLTGPADADQPVAVISHRLWRRLFHEDRQVVGTIVQVGGRPCTIVGVLADGLDFELPVGGPQSTFVFTVKDVDLWRVFGAAADFPNTRQVFTFEALVKLRSGARLEQAQHAADTIAVNLARQYPETNRGRGFRLVPLRDQVVGARAPAIWIGFAGALLILATACVNAVSLALGELPGRRRDFALREALGAGRARLLRQAALESGVLALLAGAAGIALARMLVMAFAASVELPRPQDVRFDLPVAVFGMAAAFATALIARLVPVARLQGGAGGLRTWSSTHAASAPRLRRALVAAQLALALVLCLAAALYGASLRAVLLVNPGFATSHTLSARVSAFAVPYPEKADVVRFFADLTTRLRAVPGVARAAAGSSLPLSGSTSGTTVMAEGQPAPAAQRLTIGWQTVIPGYFETVGMPVRQGRDFTPQDVARDAHQVVINETLARQLFASENPIGRRVVLGPDAGVPDWHEVVGVVGDVRHTSLTETPAPRAYDLFGQHWSRTLFLVIRGHGDSPALAPVLRREVAAMDPSAPVFEVRSLDELLGAASAQRRATTIFTAGVGAASLLLAALGVYGLLAGSVAARTRELGVRRALGASTGRIMALVAREALVMSAVGIAAGLAVALAAARVIQAQLYGVAATDPLAIAAVSALLVIIAGASALVPARRAAHVDPAVALRAE